MLLFDFASSFWSELMKSSADSWCDRFASSSGILTWAEYTSREKSADQLFLESQGDQPVCMVPLRRRKLDEQERGSRREQLKFEVSTCSSKPSIGDHQVQSWPYELQTEHVSRARMSKFQRSINTSRWLACFYSSRMWVEYGMCLVNLATSFSL